MINKNQNSPFESYIQADRKVSDVVPDISFTSEISSGSSFIPPAILDPSISYFSKPGTRGRGTLVVPEYDLSEIGRIEDIDSYVKQAFDKKVALMFKEGMDLVGGSPKVSNYIKARFLQLGHASKRPIALLFRELGSSLVRKQNAFCLKVRKASASGGKPYRNPQDKLVQPIAALFGLPAETMFPVVKGNKITAWQQRMPDGSYKTYDVDDIIHIHYQKKDGFAIATPSLLPVIDDVGTLRKIEQDIEMLVYQHLFPLFQWQIGTESSPAGIDERTGDREVDIMSREIESMPTEGGIVTTERHTIKAIGAEGRALRIEGYLEHFKKRVLAGLGVSSVDMGDGDTSNRATADNMSRNLIDAVKDFQQVFEIFINYYLVDELLLESAFSRSEYLSEGTPKLCFREVDIDAQHKKESHAADLFAKNVLGMSEARGRMGLDPILLPSYTDIRDEKDTKEKFPMWNELAFKLFELPKFLIQSLDEPWTNEAKGSLKTRTETEKAATPSKPGATTSGPSNKKSNATINDGLVVEAIVELATFFGQGGAANTTPDFAKGLVETQMRLTTKHLLSDQMAAFREGYASQGGAVDTVGYMRTAAEVRGLLRERSDKYINKLSKQMGGDVRSFFKKDSIETAEDLRLILSSYTRRGTFIESVETEKAHNLGKLMSARDQVGGYVSIFHNDGACPKCKSLSISNLETKMVSLDMLPPHHPDCVCKMTVEAKAMAEGLANEGNHDTTKIRLEQIPVVSLFQIKNALATRFPSWSSVKLSKVSERVGNTVFKDGTNDKEID